MVVNFPIKSTVRRTSHSSNKSLPKEPGAATLFSSTSPTISYSSNNDDRFDLPSDSSFSDIADVESSYTSTKRLKLENSSNGKSQSYKLSGKGSTKVLEQGVSLDDGPKMKADMLNPMLTSAGRTTYVSNKRDVNFDTNLTESLPNLATGKKESYEKYYSNATSRIPQEEEDVGVEIFGDDNLDNCQVVPINDDELITFPYPETESDMEFDEEVFFKSIDGMHREGKKQPFFEKGLNGNNCEEYMLLNLDGSRVIERNSYTALNVPDVSHLDHNLQNIKENEFHAPVDESFNLGNVVIGAKRKNSEYLYISSREELSASSFSEEGSGNDSFENDHKVEEVVYRDDDSTDEDESLPPPDTIRKKIGSKACEIIDSKKIGIKAPKLCIWSLSDKPFSVINGLCTKSLYPLGGGVATHESWSSSSSSSSSSINSQEEQEENPIFDNGTMLSDLLNICGPEIEEVSDSSTRSVHEPMFEISKGPLSSFWGRRNSSKETVASCDLNVSTSSREETCFVDENKSRNEIESCFCPAVSHGEIEKDLRVRRRRLKLKRNQGGLTPINNLVDHVGRF